ncbi:MAG: response regulator [Spirochaetales bacterium]|nr:response regulator [Leptospiraceae bacterium]MCP5481584.1 response regulator [Spirochaetales bacterium]MCP5484412.1 response regulator [Spirochaetales bacterium]
MASIFVLDADSANRRTLPGAMQAHLHSFDLRFFSRPEEMLSALDRESCDAIVASAELPGMSIFDLLEQLNGRGLPILVMSGSGSQRLAVECLRAGAQDFVAWRSVKFGFLPGLMQRLLLEGEPATGAGAVRELTRDIRSYIGDEELDLEKERLHHGEESETAGALQPGRTYEVLFLYVNLQISRVAARAAPEWLARLTHHILDSLGRIPASYQSSLSHFENDSCFFGFIDRSHMRAVLAAFGMRAELSLLNVSVENLLDSIGATMALAMGTMKYREDTGRIHSDALNQAAHIAQRSSESSRIYLTQDVYDGLGHRARRYFEATDPIDGVPVYGHSLP